MNAACEQFDVAIVGLGPTGLTLAHALGMRGLQVLVLEREPKFYGNARAVYTDGECMRIFQSLGIAHTLAADMLQDVPVQMVLPDGSVLLQIKNTQRPYGWPVSNFFYQPALETALAAGLARYSNVKVLRGRELARFEQDANAVDVYHVATEGTGYCKPAPEPGARTQPLPGEARVRAQSLVGADGGRSAVRTQLGIQMVGKSFPNPWLVVDLKLKDATDGLRHLPYFNFICDPALPTVSCVQPDGHHRFEFMLMPGQTREYMLRPDTIRHYLSKHVDVDKFEILRALVYTFNALMAERWRERRVLLAGDAAHMTPQFIGQGMNAGVRDAFNLAWKLDAVIRGQAGDALLDTYERERRPHAGAMIREAERMKDFVSMVNPAGTLLRNALARLITKLPVIGRYVCQGDFIPKPAYAAGSYFGLPRASRRGAEGRMLPQPSVRGPDGRRRMLDELTGNGFVLIGAGVDPSVTLSASDRALWDALGARYVAMYEFGRRPTSDVDDAIPAHLIEMEDPEGSFFAWLRSSGGRSGSVAIVRPDKFVFALVPGKELSSATLAVARQLHWPPASALDPAPLSLEPVMKEAA